MSKLKKFLILSADDFAIMVLILGLSYIFLKDYFILICIITIIGSIIFFIIKYLLLKPVLGEEKKTYDVKGKVGIVIRDIIGEGVILVDGERWKARAIGNKKIPRGRKVRIIDRRNLTVIVDEY